MPVPPHVRAVAFAAGLAVALGVPAARADIVIVEQDVEIEPDRVDTEDRPQDFRYWISRADCEGETSLTLPVKPTNLQTGSRLEVWLGFGDTDCALYDERTKEGTTCHMASTQQVNLDDVIDVVLTARQIASAGGYGDCIDESGTTAEGQALTVYFMLLTDVGQDAAAPNLATFPTGIDLVGPSAPTNVTAGPAGPLLNLSYDTTTGESEDGFLVFCEAVSTDGAGGAGGAGTTATTTAAATTTTTTAGGGEGGAGGAGEGGEGGAGGDGGATSSAATTTAATTTVATTSTATGSNPDECPLPTTFVSGALPPAITEELPFCGRIEGADGGNTRELTIGQLYVVAVAAIDELGNAGPLSELACATPEPVDDFFAKYRQAGGEAGGGFCSIEAPRARAWHVAAALACVAAVAGVRRARRRR